MNKFKYQFEPYSGVKSRHTCPSCNRKNCFTRYVDVNGNYFGNDIGCCDHILSCGFHRKPDTTVNLEPIKVSYIKKPPTFIKDFSNIDEHPNGNLFRSLLKHFPESEVLDVYKRYKVSSTSLKWANSEIFPQVDLDGNWRTAKIMLYDDNGKRVKHPYSHVSWIHSKINDYVLEQCLFGLHLVTDDVNDIFIVESEKTAIICSLFFKDSIFLATGGLNNVKKDKFKDIAYKRVVAIPDKCAYDVWYKAFTDLNVRISRILEDNDEVKAGEDFADYLLNEKK